MNACTIQTRLIEKVTRKRPARGVGLYGATPLGGPDRDSFVASRGIFEENCHALKYRVVLSRQTGDNLY